MVEKWRGNERGVIINVYVESKTLQSDEKISRIKKRNPIRITSRPRVPKARTRGYDRRAQLLAYARELRRVDAEQLNRPFTNSGRKSEKRRLSAIGEMIGRFFSRFHREKRLWKYEAIGREVYSNGHRKWSYGRRKRFHFCKKFMCWWKKISGAWKCNNGANDYFH